MKRLEDEAGRVGDGHVKNRITWSCWRRTRRATASQGQSRGSVSQEGNRRDCMPVLRTMGATPESLEKPSEELAGEELLLVTSAIRTLEGIDLKRQG